MRKLICNTVGYDDGHVTGYGTRCCASSGRNDGHRNTSGCWLYWFMDPMLLIPALAAQVAPLVRAQ